MPHLNLNSDEKKKRFTYKACYFALIGFFAYLCVFLISFTLFSLNRHLQNILGFGFILSFIPLAVAARTLQRLKVTVHYEPPEYSIPYKTHKNITLIYIFIGFYILIIISLLLNSVKWDTITAATAMMALIGLLVLLVTWNGVILSDDYLLHYVCWTKHKIPYQDISTLKLYKSRQYRLGIYTNKKLEPATEINLQLITKNDLIVILKVIHQNNSEAKMNELATQVMGGDFPTA